MLLHLAGVAYIAATDLPGLKFQGGSQEEQKIEALPTWTIATGVAVVLVPSLAMGMACIALTLYFMQKTPTLMFNVLFGLSIGLLCLDVGLLAASGSINGIVLGVLCCPALHVHWTARIGPPASGHLH